MGPSDSVIDLFLNRNIKPVASHKKREKPIPSHKSVDTKGVTIGSSSVRDRARAAVNNFLENLRQQPISRIADIVGANPITALQQSVIHGRDPLETLGPDTAALPFAWYRTGPLKKEGGRVFHGTSRRAFEYLDPFKSNRRTDILGEFQPHAAERARYSEGYTGVSDVDTRYYGSKGPRMYAMEPSPETKVLDLIHPDTADDISQTIAALPPDARVRAISKWKELQKSKTSDYTSGINIDREKALADPRTKDILDRRVLNEFAEWLKGEVNNPYTYRNLPFGAVRYNDIGEPAWVFTPETQLFSSFGGKLGTNLKAPQKNLEVFNTGIQGVPGGSTAELISPQNARGQKWYQESGHEINQPKYIIGNKYEINTGTSKFTVINTGSNVDKIEFDNIVNNPKIKISDLGKANKSDFQNIFGPKSYEKMIKITGENAAKLGKKVPISQPKVEPYNPNAPGTFSDLQDNYRAGNVSEADYKRQLEKYFPDYLKEKEAAKVSKYIEPTNIPSASSKKIVKIKSPHTGEVFDKPEYEAYLLNKDYGWSYVNEPIKTQSKAPYDFAPGSYQFKDEKGNPYWANITKRHEFEQLKKSLGEPTNYRPFQESSYEPSQSFGQAPAIITPYKSAKVLRELPGGLHGAKLYSDPQGMLNVYKPQSNPIAGYAEQYGSGISSDMNYGITPSAIYAPSHPFGPGITQSYIKGAEKLPSNLMFLNPSQIKQLQEEQIADWLISNYDARPENFLLDPSGAVRPIDKGQSWKYWQQDQLTPYFHPQYNPNAIVGQDDPLGMKIYNRMYDAWKKGNLNLDPQHSINYAEDVLNYPGKYLDYSQKFAEMAYPPDKVSQFMKHQEQKLKNLPTDIAKFWTK